MSRQNDRTLLRLFKVFSLCMIFLAGMLAGTGDPWGYALAIAWAIMLTVETD